MYFNRYCCCSCLSQTLHECMYYMCRSQKPLLNHPEPRSAKQDRPMKCRQTVPRATPSALETVPFLAPMGAGKWCRASATGQIERIGGQTFPWLREIRKLQLGNHVHTSIIVFCLLSIFKCGSGCDVFYYVPAAPNRESCDL